MTKTARNLMMVYEQVIYYHAHAHDMRVRAVVSAAFRSEFSLSAAYHYTKLKLPSTVMHEIHMYSYVYFVLDLRR